MYHRLLETGMGLGNPDPCLLSNNYDLSSEIWDEFSQDFADNYKLIKDYGGFDFNFSNSVFSIGIEPTYKYDQFLIIDFDLTDKNNSRITTGISFGDYGSGRRSKTVKYHDYHKKSKFIKFIDKWYDFVVDSILLSPTQKLIENTK